MSRAKADSAGSFSTWHIPCSTPAVGRSDCCRFALKANGLLDAHAELVFPHLEGRLRDFEAASLFTAGLISIEPLPNEVPDVAVLVLQLDHAHSVGLFHLCSPVSADLRLLG